MLGKLNGIGVTDHVVEQHDATHPGQLHATGEDREACGIHRYLGADLDFLLRLGLPRIVEPAVGPMAVRTEDHGTFAVLEAVGQGGTIGPEEGPGDEVTREGFKDDTLHLITAPIDRAVNHRIERRSFGKRPKGRRRLGSATRCPRAGIPLRNISDLVEGELAVERERGRGGCRRREG